MVVALWLFPILHSHTRVDADADVDMANALSSLAILKATHEDSEALRGNNEVKYETENLSNGSFVAVMMVL